MGPFVILSKAKDLACDGPSSFAALRMTGHGPVRDGINYWGFHHE